MKIQRVDKGSPADLWDLRPDDELVSMNGNPIRDEIDFQYFSGDAPLRLLLRRNGQVVEKRSTKGFGGPSGLTFYGMKYRRCGNDCVFCFVDQNPPGLRTALYFKDEDYRLSFLYGNYVTLTNASASSLQRIVEQHLSPIYISVHAVDLKVRQRLLGLRRDDRLLEKIRFLRQNRIHMHGQVVLCPGWNDGAVLEETITTLAKFFPYFSSVAVVPLGLTRHRKDLTSLTPVRKRDAVKTVVQVESYAEIFKRSFANYFVYLADEFYLKAGFEIPRKSRYDDFPQIENGVGMCRNFIAQIGREKRYFPFSVVNKKISFVTGASAAPILQKYLLPAFHSVQGLRSNLFPVKNQFYGSSVTVSGLLVGRDIARQLKNEQLGDLVLLPPNCLNHDDLFLDNWTIAGLEQALGVHVYQPHRLQEVFSNL